MSKRVIKKIALLLAVLSCGMLTACAANTPTAEPAHTESPAPSSAPSPTPVPEPETVAGFIKGATADIYFAELNRGDTVECIDKATVEGYSIVKYGKVYGLVETRRLKLNTEADYEHWSGYCGSNAMLYKDIDLTIEEEKQEFNSEVTVLDAFENCYLVKAGDDTGFMKIDTVSSAPNAVWYGGWSGGGSSGGGGGSSGGGQDGGDITLRAYGSAGYQPVLLAVTVEQKGESAGEATVRVDGTKVLAGLFEYGDEVRVLGIDGNTAKIYIYNNEASMDSRLLRLKTDDSYPAWEGYVTSEGWTYTSAELTGKSENKIALNTVVEVLEPFEGCYLVRADGELVYMTVDGVSETQTVSTYYYGGGGGDAGGGGGADAGWTEPML